MKTEETSLTPDQMTPPPQSPKRSTKQPRSRRHNKLYRTPMTPTENLLRESEKSFVLDRQAANLKKRLRSGVKEAGALQYGNSIAVSNISDDYARAKPKHGTAIPPYNSQHDSKCSNYFGFVGVKSTLRKTDQLANGGTSADGDVFDRFYNKGHGHQYLSTRNKDGAGNSTDQVDGHAQFLKDPKPIYGYNGKFGFRRNTPWLRTTPSPFGTGRSPTC